MTDTTATATTNETGSSDTAADARRRTAESARQTADAAREAVGASADQIRQSVDEIRAEVSREVNVRAQQARDWAEERADQLRTTVTEKPFASAGTAFAVGVILGVLLARR